MVLTKQRSPRNPDDFPTVQLFLLAIVRLSEPIALTSIFPYAWELVKKFEVASEEYASFYAGLLISSFALAEALMGMYWGSLSDRIGRKPVLLIGCIGTMLSMIFVGVATNFWIALLGRLFGGLLNGSIGCIQTIISELVTKPEHEPYAYSVMPFVWSIGTIIGPAIGGLFANPHDTFPDVFPTGSLFHVFPYLLPNLLCAFLLLISILLGFLLLEETHPDMQPQVALPDTYVSEETPLLETSDAIKQPAFDLRAETYGALRNRHSGEFDHNSICIKETQATEPSLSIYSNQIIALVASLSIFTYHSMTYDHLLPIFFEDKKVLINALHHPFNPFYSPGGLGLSMQTVGMILAVNGAIALFVQAVIFPLAAARLGVFRLFILSTVLHPLVYVIVPFLVYVPESMLYPAIYACLTVRNLFSITLYPLLLILIKDAAPSRSVLGKVNGLAASAGAAFRMIAPPVAGYLYKIGSEIDCTGVAWYGSAVVALVGTIQCFSVKREKTEDASVERGSLSKAECNPTVTVTELSESESEDGA